ncbi:MAG: LysR family transcriptional regulator [Clostridia bacterium]|nr:LysR family transcriptional regulator [Clostridia bacterium]
MEIRLLKYFLAVAREENITAAAESLHITQPTLSKQLMELEDELGKKLFIRGKRKITLTEDGIILRKRAGEIINLVEKTQSELSSLDEETISGDIYIGASETDGMRIIAKASNNLQKKYPNIHYHLFSGNSEDVLEKLDKGLIDFGILSEPSDIKKYGYIKLPAFDIWGLLMRKDSPLAKKNYLEPDDLLNIPLLCSRQALTNNEFSSWFGNTIEKLNVVATYNLVYNASLFVEEGFGYALTFDKLINLSDDSNLCFKPVVPNLKANLVMVWKKYQVFSKATQKFLDELQKEINIQK